MSEANARAGAGKLPETFQQRGIAAPFTTRILSFARYRRSHGAADILVPGLGAGTEVYVIPFKTLPGVFSMTVFDRALHEQLGRLHMVTPLSMRQAAMEVAQTGLAGPQPMRRARAWKERQGVLRNKVLFGLLKSAVAQLGGTGEDAQSMDERALMTPEGLAAARRALRGFAEQAGVNGGEIIKRLEIWSEMVVPVGAHEGEGLEGPLAERIAEVEGLADDLSKWLIPEPPDTAEMAQRTATAGRAMAKEARGVMERLHGMARDMGGPLHDWDKSKVQINRRVERIAYLTDGWRRILDMWEIAQRSDRNEQRDVLETFAQHIPILPLEAVGADELWMDLRESQARWIRNSRQRVDSDIDDDTRDKLNQFRQEAA